MLQVAIPGEPSGSQISGLEKLRKKFQQNQKEPGPSLLLLDFDGRPYAEINSHEAPLEYYLHQIEGALQMRKKRDTAFHRASNALGFEKAKLLNEGLEARHENDSYHDNIMDWSIPETSIEHHYQDILAKIIANDPEDHFGRGRQLKEWKKISNFRCKTRCVRKTNQRTGRGTQHHACLQRFPFRTPLTSRQFFDQSP
jgi:hypothetical protein